MEKKIPSYEQMLEMDDEDFKKWILIRIEKPHRERFLEEMSVHEERTGSFRKTMRVQATHGEKLILEVFNRENKVAGAMENLVNEGMTDLIQEAILAKAASDYEMTHL